MGTFSLFTFNVILVNFQILFASKYLSRAYEMHGGEITTEGGGLLISFSSGEKYIEAVPENTEYEEGSGIRVGLKNSSTCTSVTAVITTSDQKEIQTTHEITYGSTVFTIPVSDEQISSYRLIFNGDPKGKIEILSVMAVQCYSPKNTYGEISEVRISRDKKNITVKGSLSSEELELLSGAKLRLYELGLDQDISDVTLSVSPISETDLDSSSFELSVPIDENFDRLFKKYAVAAITQNGLVHIGSAKAINNPNIFAEEKVTLPESIKGSSYLFDNYFLDGIAQTTVDVYADELISDSPNKISYTDGGRKYSFSADYVEMLDSIMKRYSIEGISVRFILKLRSPSENTVYSYLHHPQNSGGSV